MSVPPEVYLDLTWLDLWDTGLSPTMYLEKFLIADWNTFLKFNQDHSIKLKQR